MFTREMELAYVILKYLSQDETKAVTVEVLAKALNTTPTFIRKIRQRLKNAELVVSLGHRGVIRTSKKIKLSELYLLFNEKPEGALGEATMAFLSGWEI